MTKKIAKTRFVQFDYNNGEVTSVFLVGDFNAWDEKKDEIKKNDDGTRRKTLMLPPGTYEYKFLVDGQWKNDPSNEKTSVNCFNTLNNVIHVH
jgi:1,4-alpha-glucan branching enzyme